MQSLGACGVSILRPMVRAADGLAHNRERRRTIHRYRRIDSVVLVTEPGLNGAASAAARRSI